ncbi:MAG: PH domain-containing protein [Actinomycetia bacterium]|nr:PH domain-containing protein [Actinomycetes bacterium]
MTEADPPPPSVDGERAAALVALSAPGRMSPIAMVFGFGRRLRSAFRQFGLVVAIAALQAGGRAAILALLGGILVTAVSSILSWWRFTFRVERDELVVEEGVISQRRLAVPIGRIQGVSVDQQLTHRLLGQVRVAVDTAGSADDEVILDAVPRSVAHHLRMVVLGGVSGREEAPAPGPSQRVQDGSILLRRTPRDLTVVALTRSPFRFLGAAVGSLVALSTSLDNFVDPDEVGRVVQDNQPVGAALAALLTVALVGVFALSVLGVHLRYHRLELSLTSRGLRTTSGLIERRERIAPLARIQRIRWSANPLQRWVGLNSVAVDQVHAGPGAEGTTGGVRLPGTRTAELDEILDLHLPGSRRPPRLDRGLPMAILQRQLGFVGTASAVALVLAWLAVGPGRWLAAIIAGSIVLAVGRVLTWRAFRWGLTPSVIEISQGPFLRRTSVVRIQKVQSTSMTRGLFDRRRGLATLDLSTASGAVHLPHIEVDIARGLRDHALSLVESSVERWM